MQLCNDQKARLAILESHHLHCNVPLLKTALQQSPPASLQVLYAAPDSSDPYHNVACNTTLSRNASIRVSNSGVSAPKISALESADPTMALQRLSLGRRWRNSNI